MPANYTGHCDANGFYHEDNQKRAWLDVWISNIGGWLLCVGLPVSLWGVIGLIVWSWKNL